MGNARSRAPGWYWDAFVLGMESPDFDRKWGMELIEDISSSWVIDEGEFEHQPKREPALLYARKIPTSVGAAEVVAKCFERLAAEPEAVIALYPE